MMTACRLLYIVGSGRSGSTLLDLLLNNSPFIQSVGEMSSLSSHARTDAEKCTCGAAITQCSFWRAVEERVRRRLSMPETERPLLAVDPRIRAEHLHWTARALQEASLVLGWSPLYQLVANAFARRHLRAASNSQLWYEAIRSETGCPIVLDSSKDPRRCKILYLSGTADVRVIFLVRDGRAVAASHMRRRDMDMATAACV